MAITAGNLTHTRLDGSVIPSGSLHALFPAKRVGAGTDYAAVVVHNGHATLTLSTVKAWLTQNAGAAVAIAYGSAPIAEAASFPEIDASALTYSSPSTKAAGLALANLLPGQKVLLYVRRVFTSATAADPQTSRLYLGGTSPL